MLDLKVRFGFLIMLSVVTLTACVDRDFDEPPIGGVTGDLPAEGFQTSIGEVLSYYEPGELITIPDSLYMRGVINADDEFGNIFKELLLQDENDGMRLRVDKVNMFNQLFTGREVFVLVKDLVIGDFAGTIQMGIGSENGEDNNRIPEALADQIIIPGEFLGDLEPAVVTINDLNDSYMNRLIQLQDVETASRNPGTIGDISMPASPQNKNISIENCDGDEITLRSSGFSDFAGEEMPTGNGSITAIYSRFNDTKQLTIRDLMDLELQGTRCGGGGGNVDPNAFFDEDGNFIGDVNKVVSIADFKSQSYQEGQVQLIEDEIILLGQVVSSDETGNFFKEIVFQDETAGIKVRIDKFDLFQEYPLGADIAVQVQGLSIGDFNGLIQIGVGAGDDVNRIPEDEYQNFVFAGQVKSSPTVTDVAIEDLDDTYQNRLIRLSGVETVSSNPGTYADATNQQNRNIDMQDCDDNTFVLRNSGFATFAGASMPSGNGSITAVYGVFGDTKQIFIRNTDDVNLTGQRCSGGGGGGSDCGPGGMGVLPEDFEDGPDFLDPWAESGWFNCAAQGDRQWLWRDFEDNGFVEARGFQEAQSTIDTWLITPEIDLNQYGSISFLTATAFWTHDALTVWVSPTFDDPADADWTQLSPVLAGQSEENYDWVQSGDVALDGSGVVRVGFRHQGNNSDLTGTYRIDDVAVK